MIESDAQLEPMPDTVDSDNITSTPIKEGGTFNEERQAIIKEIEEKAYQRKISTDADVDTEEDVSATEKIARMNERVDREERESGLNVKGELPPPNQLSVSAVGDIGGQEQNEKMPTNKKENTSLLTETLDQILIKNPKKGKWPSILNREKEIEWPDLTKAHNSVRLDVESSGTILVRVVTWNQQAQTPPDRDKLRERLLIEDRYHLYVIGTQECEHSIAHSLVNQSKLQWETLLRETLGHHYDMIQSHTLQASHIIMFLHKALTPFITDLSSFSVPCGIGNQLGNKGAIAISMTISSTSLLFINSHLTSGQGAYRLRNLNYHRIQNGLIKAIKQNSKKKDEEMGKEVKLDNSKKNIIRKNKVYPMDITESMKSEEVDGTNSYLSEDRKNIDTIMEPTTAPELNTELYSTSFFENILQSVSHDPTLDPSSKIYDYYNPRYKLVDLFDHVFWFGDFNYRINGTVNTISSLLKSDYHEVLLNNDQLHIAMRKKEAFHGFSEGPLNFRPTYKFKKGTNEYDIDKKRVPSWTDRVLYTSNGNRLLLYSSVRELKSSDHRPVMASFKTKVNIDSVPSQLATVGNHKSEVCNIS